MTTAASEDSHYSKSWAEARQKFLDVAALAKADRIISLPLGELKDPTGNPLFIDFAVFGDVKAPPSEVLLHSSGTHGASARLMLSLSGHHHVLSRAGVEGFAGSAIQHRYLLDGHLQKHVSEHKERGALFIFLHVVNPYGMAWCVHTPELCCDEAVDLDMVQVASVEREQRRPQSELPDRRERARQRAAE